MNTYFNHNRKLSNSSKLDLLHKQSLNGTDHHHVKQSQLCAASQVRRPPQLWARQPAASKDCASVIKTRQQEVWRGASAVGRRVRTTVCRDILPELERHAAEPASTGGHLPANLPSVGFFTVPLNSVMISASKEQTVLNDSKLPILADPSFSYKYGQLLTCPSLLLLLGHKSCHQLQQHQACTAFPSWGHTSSTDWFLDCSTQPCLCSQLTHAIHLKNKEKNLTSC